MLKNLKKIFCGKKLTSVLIALALMCTVLTCVSCNILNDLFTTEDTIKNNGIDELLNTISSRYIGTYDEDELINDAKRAIVYALDDQWSYYLTPEEYAAYLENSDNSYQGIGVEVIIDDDIGGIEVRRVYSGSGAENAGIVIGDIITEIDGESLRGLDMDGIRLMLRRPLNDTALLTVLRADGDFHEITVVYSIIFQDPVSYEMLENKIGYVYLRNFDTGASDSFIEAVEDLISQGASGIIYDVRENLGGKVNEMCAILDFLLPEGDIFISVDKEGEENVITSDASFTDLPAVVLVNSHSYSGAEYFTAALSEYNYAITVGEQTTGKNRMQTTLPLKSGGALHISTGMFLTPKRVDLFEQGGYTPDYIIEFTEDEWMSFYKGELSLLDDPQSQKAIELLTVLTNSDILL